MSRISISKLAITFSLTALFFIAPLQELHAKVISYSGSVFGTDPCTGTSVTVHGTFTIYINKTPNGVFVYEHFSGLENGYGANFFGRGKFYRTSTSYKVKINGYFDGPLVFPLTGVDVISATPDGLVATKNSIQASNICK